MFKYEIYNPNKNYMMGNGESGHQNVLKYFPGVEDFVHVVETDEGGEFMYALQSFSATKSQFGIPQEMSVEEALAEMERIRNLPPPEAPISAEERIAAAMEFQNLMNM